MGVGRPTRHRAKKSKNNANNNYDKIKFLRSDATMERYSAK